MIVLFSDHAAVQAAGDERHRHEKLRHRVHRRVGRADASGRRRPAVRVLGHLGGRRGRLLPVFVPGSELGPHPFVGSQPVTAADSLRMISSRTKKQSCHVSMKKSNLFALISKVAEAIRSKRGELKKVYE